MNSSKITRSARLAGLTALSLGGLVATAQADTLRLWTTQEQPDRLARQQVMADQFKEKTGHTVEVIPVTESDLGKRATAAFAANDLPDVIYHTLQYALPWAEAGILDVDAATEVLEDLGLDTFSPGPLAMAAFEDGYASVPADGYTQMIIYREDLFEEKGLAPPTSYAAVMDAATALSKPPGMFGFVAPTKVDENFMSQVLEHVFLANGVSPVGPDGFKALEEEPTTQVLEFYKAIVEASPPGDLMWKEARELYFSGQAAMIIWSPFILDELAGLRDDSPPTINGDPETRELADKTAVVTTFSGPSNTDGAAWADVSYFGITSDANSNVAQEFVEFSMSDAYLGTLAIAPEGKFPVRTGTEDEPGVFKDGWAKLDVGVDRRAPLGDIYPVEVMDEIVSGLDKAQRWGVEDSQLSLASKMINTQIINRVVREFVDGKIDAPAAIAAMNSELANVK